MVLESPKGKWHKGKSGVSGTGYEKKHGRGRGNSLEH